MAQGLQILDGSGNIILDTNTNVPRIIGQVDVSGADGNISDSRFSTGTPFYYYLKDSGTDSAFASDINVSFSGNTMYWTVADSTTIGRLLYGVFM